DPRGVELGGGGTQLIGEVDRAILANEVLAPPDAPIRRGFPRLAAETAAVHHHDGYVLISTRWNLKLHVHLVARDVPAGARTGGSDRFRFAADEKTALALEHQRRKSRGRCR